MFRLVLLALIGCTNTPPESQKAAPLSDPSAPERTTETADTKVSSPVTAPVSPPASGESAQVVLVWDGISPLHKTFFLDEAAVEQLGRDLWGHVQPPANVYISFDSKWHVGRILLRLLPGTGIGLDPGEGEGLDLGVVSPILQGLARYRSRVAARYDTRVESFHVGIDSYRGPSHCRFGAAGPLPPDGTQVDGCVQVNGVKRCGVSNGSSLQFDSEVAETVRACLR